MKWSREKACEDLAGPIPLFISLSRHFPAIQYLYPSMRILDIGAGMDATYGPAQDAQLRWRFRDTADQVRKLIGTDVFLEVDGIDLRAPESFRDERRKVAFTGYDLDRIPKREYCVMTWLYPHPWEVMDQETGKPRKDRNPLDTVKRAVHDNLAQGGLLILETDMDPGQPASSLKPQPSDALRLILGTVDKLLTRTALGFHTDEPLRRLGLIYRKSA